MRAKLGQIKQNHWAAWLLEALSPLSIIGAALIYISAPLTRFFFDSDSLKKTARWLEEPQNLRDLADLMAHYEEQDL